MPTIPEDIDLRDAILFVGSGFTADAENIQRGPVPTGSALRNQFATYLSVDAATYPLTVLAQAVVDKSMGQLYRMLYEAFTISNLQAYQRSIVIHPWRRIYTTNYDDAIEFALLRASMPIRSFSYRDEKPRELHRGSIIHLHGTIRDLTEENCVDVLVLNEQSYIEQFFQRSPWYSEFVRDLRQSSACFFAGYSLMDYHINALLMQADELARKTYFITRPGPDQITADRLKRYGQVVPSGLEAFAEALERIPTPAPTSDPHRLKSFKYLDPYLDKKTLLNPTSSEVSRLLTFGAFNVQRCFSTLPRPRYVVPRQNAIESALQSLRAVPFLVVHSHIGNGKSLFNYLLAHRLSETGYTCFLVKSNPECRADDIAILKETEHLAIFFDSYDDAIGLVPTLISELPAQTRYVVSVRTGVYDVRQHESHEAFPARRHQLSLNRLDGADRRDFKILLGETGLGGGGVSDTITNAKDLRDIVLTLYQNRQVQHMLSEALEPCLRDSGLKQVLIMTNLLKWLGEDGDAADIIRVATGLDIYEQQRRFGEIAADIFQVDDNGIRVQSPLFAEYLVLHMFRADDVMSAIYELIIASVRRKAERRYRIVMSSLMQFGNLRRLLARDADFINRVVGLYERLRYDVDVNNEPLFWLQYAIAMTETDDLPLAENLLRAAYDRAAAIPGFRTYQIDTQALRIYLMIEARETTHTVTRFEAIMALGEAVRAMIGQESHRIFAIRVLSGFHPFVTARERSLSVDERAALVGLFDALLVTLRTFGTSMRFFASESAVVDADQAISSLTEARKILAGGV